MTCQVPLLLGRIALCRSHIARRTGQPLKPLLFLGINGRVGKLFVFLGLGFQFVRLFWHGDYSTVAVDHLNQLHNKQKAPLSPTAEEDKHLSPSFLPTHKGPR